MIRKIPAGITNCRGLPKSQQLFRDFSGVSLTFVSLGVIETEKKLIYNEKDISLNRACLCNRT